MSAHDDAQMPFLLLQAFNHLVDEVHSQLAQEGFPGLRASHGFAMQAIGEGCTTVELGQRLQVTKQAAAQAAKVLEGMGFIERRPSERDRRERILVPTDRGREMLERSAAAFRREVARWRGEIGDPGVDAVLTTLGAVTVGDGQRRDP